MAGTEKTIQADTLLVAIGEAPETDCLHSAEIEVKGSGAITVDTRTLATSMPGVFAGGDATTGSNTVVDAIAAGKRAARSVDRYLSGDSIDVIEQVRRPDVFLERDESVQVPPDEARVASPHLASGQRTRGFGEVEGAITAEEAIREASRCLRCDQDFTRPVVQEGSQEQPEERSA